VTRRLLFTYLSLAIVVLAALEIPLGVVNARSATRDLTAKVERDAFAMASLSESTVEHEQPADLRAVRSLALRYTQDTGGRVVVVDGKGLGVIDTSPPAPGRRSFASRPEFAAALRGEVATGTRHSTTLNATFLFVAVPIASGGRILGAVRVTYPTSTLDARVRRYWLVLAGIAGVVLAVALLLGVSFARWIRRPLAGLEQAAARVSGGDLAVRAAVPDGPPELRALTLQFNEMVVKLEALVDAQRDFVADASHELRTPLTALRLRLENLEQSVDARGRAGLDAARAEIERLSGIVEALLALARADAAGTPATPADIGAVVRGRVDTWRVAAEERGVELRLDAGQVPPSRANADRVAQVLDNLLANALDASPPAGVVTVSTEALAGRLVIRVRDEGPGLSAEQKARAFDRFWRGSTRGGGSGLGLAIARRLVEADEGTIELGDAAGHGLEATVTLHAAPPA
jgi:signal transduction histidine kinase